MMTRSRLSLLLLGSLLTCLVSMAVASVRHPSSTASSHAFIAPGLAAAARGGVNQDNINVLPVPIHHHHRLPRGTKGVKGIKLQAEAQGGAKKTKAKKSSTKSTKTAAAAPAKIEVEVFKKADFVASLSEKTGLTRRDADLALQAVLETLTEQLALDKKVSFQGFGSFQVRERAARKGRNPRTGEEIDIPASKSPAFSPSKTLKDRVNGRE